MSQNTKHFERNLFEKLLHSELFKTYQNAFRTATGLPLRLVDGSTHEWCLDDQSVNRSPFCEKLNLCKTTCVACVDVNQRLMEEAKVKGATSCHCFAGMSTTAVPIIHGNQLIGFLKTGQVFNAVPSVSNFNAVARTLARQGMDKAEVAALRDAYLQTRSVEPERYQSMVTLLATFAEQFSKHAEKLVTISENSEPVSITRARDFIEANLSEPLPLGLVSRQSGVSESHLCRLFKEHVGLTLTDYINRRRIDWAKEELLKTDTRISEIAFQVGYQSLSQFNRAFARVTGRTPSTFRREELAETPA